MRYDAGGNFFGDINAVQFRVQCGRELQERRRRGPAVLGRDVKSALRPGLLRQDGVCLVRVYDLHQHVQRATVHSEGDRECRGLLCVDLQLGLFDAAAAPTQCDALGGGGTRSRRCSRRGLR